MIYIYIYMIYTYMWYLHIYDIYIYMIYTYLWYIQYIYINTYIYIYMIYTYIYMIYTYIWYIYIYMMIYMNHSSSPKKYGSETLPGSKARQAFFAAMDGFSTQNEAPLFSCGDDPIQIWLVGGWVSTHLKNMLVILDHETPRIGMKIKKSLSCHQPNDHDLKFC